MSLPLKFPQSPRTELYLRLKRRLKSCCASNGELSPLLVAEATGFSRQYIHKICATGRMSRSAAFHILASFPTELKNADIKAFVQYRD